MPPGSKSALKALSWLSRAAGLSFLWSIFQDSLITAFRSQKVADRREALPLPLAVVVAWERRLCDADCPSDLCILLGGFLLAVHGGLRFGDLQRIRLSSHPACPSQPPASEGCAGRLRLPGKGNRFRYFRQISAYPMGLAIPASRASSLDQDRASLFPASLP